MSKKTPAFAEVGDSGVRDDQLGLRVGVDEARQAVRDRRQPAATVDKDRHPPLGREREHRREPLVVEQEALGPRVQLDPASAEVEATGRLLDRIFPEVEPDERDQSPAGAPRLLERPVVGRSEGRVPVGLVHAEHEGARDAVALVDRLELLVDAGHAVDVVAKVNVGIEDLRVRRQLAGELLVVPGDQRLRPFEDRFHVEQL